MTIGKVALSSVQGGQIWVRRVQDAMSVRIIGEED